MQEDNRRLRKTVLELRKELKQSDDTFELHSVQVELEAVEKQIRQLLERQAELRAALESSRALCTQDALFPDVLHSGAGTPRTLGAAAAEDASQATDDDLSPSAAPGLRDLHLEPLRSPPRDGTRRCDCRRFHRQIPAILKDESVGAIVLHAGVNDIRLRQTEVLKRDFGSLIETVRSTAPATRIIVSGPLPTMASLAKARHYHFGIVSRCVPEDNATVEDLLVAVRDQIGHENIVSASRMNQAVVVFFKEQNLVNR
ncbi:hypothetical protein QQF64_033865 [Cirrhinus molitorella]|uniref:SGNH hydrolase-type esterase domain-containing protein n=1 Tax=Cirrhinus molitorella TaxID=172907 RepID=A0ABR3MV45_9TELE